MGWKRRRERWRKLPTPSEPRLRAGVHWGPYLKIPKSPGGPELGVSSSGELHESRPWSPVKWLVLLPLGVVAVTVFLPLLITWVSWIPIGGIFLWLIYKTWRG